MSPALPRLGIRRRLLLTVVLAVAAGLAASVVVYDVLLDRQLARQATTLARERATVARSALRVTDGSIDASAVDARSDLSSRVWVYEGATVLVGPSVGPTLEAAAAALAAGETTTAKVGEEARLAAIPVLAGGQRVGTVVAAVSLTPYERTSHLTLIGSFVFAAGVLVVVSLLSGWMLRRALRPVAQMTAEAETWSVRDLDRRFDLGPPHDEITQLGATLDHLIARIGAALRHEQRFTAEISHELRTPLARIAAEAELALARERSSDAYREALAAVARDAAEMRDTMDGLLAAARAESGITQATSDARDCVAAVVDSHRALAAERALLLDADEGPPAIVPLEPTLVERMLAPVVDNACRYARTSVRVTVGRRAGTVVIVVEDDGPGVTPEERERILEPGVRGSAADLVPRDGAGLGLALARRLAQSAGGDLAALPSPDGGRFAIELPAA